VLTNLPLSPEGIRLLQHHNLLRPLVQAMVSEQAVADIKLDEGQVEKALGGLCQQRGIKDAKELQLFLAEAGLREEDLRRQIALPMKIEKAALQRFSTAAERRFLERKTQLDRVVYSLLRIKDRFLARELYLQIQSGEANFAELAARHSDGPERDTNGIVGPVPLTQAHPTLAEKLRTHAPGDLIEPFAAANWWLVVRLESYSPACFDDATAQLMCREVFEQWLGEETKQQLNNLLTNFSSQLSA
jgi:parvulin-like peptidyl-prolyl isomerase